MSWGRGCDSRFLLLVEGWREIFLISPPSPESMNKACFGPRRPGGRKECFHMSGCLEPLGKQSQPSLTTLDLWFSGILQWIRKILHDLRYFKPLEVWYYSILRSCRILSINSRGDAGLLQYQRHGAVSMNNARGISAAVHSRSFLVLAEGAERRAVTSCWW